MSFEQREESRHSGKPITLYLFQYGETADQAYAYTDSEQIVSLDAVNYRPIPIAADARQSSGSLDKSTLNIKVPSASDIANLFLGFPPSFVVTVTIKEGHLESSDWKVAWIGRVLSAARDEDSFAVLTCEPVATSMKRSGLRRQYILTCPHSLYGPFCQASKLAATSTQEVVILTTSTITLGDGWAPEANVPNYVGGYVQWEGTTGKQIRTILNIADLKTLYLNGATDGLSFGDLILVIKGCNHQMDDCQDVHNNILNFGGQPLIPTENPIGTGKNLYY